MKVLVLGCTGMLGHQMLRTLNDRFDAAGTYRERAARRRPRAARALECVDVTRFNTVARALAYFQPDVVVNCIGVTAQQIRDTTTTILVNSVFPHRLAALCRAREIRLLHISTDCVFSGRQGQYIEIDEPDPTDLYGRSKLLGEVIGPNCLTLRTSIIGHEVGGTTRGLLEWFLARGNQSTPGYRKAVFSGLTTGALSWIVGDVIEGFPDMSGVYHVAGPPISKHNLLRLIKGVYGVETVIKGVDKPKCDRSLNGSRFRAVTGVNSIPWKQMLEEMQDEERLLC